MSQVEKSDFGSWRPSNKRVRKMEAQIHCILISVLYTRDRLHAPAALYKENEPSYQINWKKSEKNRWRHNPGRPTHRRRFSNAGLVFVLLRVTKYLYRFKSKWNYVVSRSIRTKQSIQKRKCTSSIEVEILHFLTSKSVRSILKHVLGISVEIRNATSSFSTSM